MGRQHTGWIYVIKKASSDVLEVTSNDEVAGVGSHPYNLYFTLSHTCQRKADGTSHSRPAIRS